MEWYWAFQRGPYGLMDPKILVLIKLVWSCFEFKPHLDESLLRWSPVNNSPLWKQANSKQDHQRWMYLPSFRFIFSETSPKDISSNKPTKTRSSKMDASHSTALPHINHIKDQISQNCLKKIFLRLWVNTSPWWKTEPFVNNSPHKNCIDVDGHWTNLVTQFSVEDFFPRWPSRTFISHSWGIQFSFP